MPEGGNNPDIFATLAKMEKTKLVENTGINWEQLEKTWQHLFKLATPDMCEAFTYSRAII